MSLRAVELAAAVAAFAVAFAAVGPAAAECTCRFKGENLPMGALVCMATKAGGRLFRCEMNQNISTWQAVGDSCPSAALEPDGQGHRPAPAATTLALCGPAVESPPAGPS